ncbi:ABC transporter ATP-binding protein [Propionibacteriaceae bacterium G57]|uniref:ABC transporter ATP-binding protein n=1 Tax=Aestuariimicrobium sp. G57 TaxID=3418485 RepID=UPI003DA79425
MSEQAMSEQGREALIEGTGLVKRYGQTVAVGGVDVRVERGASLGVIGESGSGKTTLMKLVLGMTAPDEGTVRFMGEPVVAGGFGVRPWRRHMQVVLQDPYSSLTPSMRVREILAEPVRLVERRRLSADEVAGLLAEVGLAAAMAERYPHQLSGGQRQRVAIARALAVKPQVLVADEPVSALDVSVRAELLATLERIIDERGLTLVVVSHDLGVVQRLCPQTMVMSNGAVVEQGETLRLLTAPTHPVTRALVDAVPRFDESRKPEAR